MTIHPLPDTVTFVRRNYRLPTDTADTMANNRNAFINLTQQNHFRETTANTLRMGGGNCHTALDQAAAGDGRGSATIIYFSNAIRAQQSGLPAPPFVGLAHELIHAMHALAGDKKATTQEEEQRTVGLAAYAKEAICENALRQDASLPLRLRY
ncbi:type III secretion system effector protein [bacterium]|nr:type III secretion system effector protein [Mariniblastus sp.]MDB4399598.1 type III secretion system effector protein [bacterium]